MDPEVGLVQCILLTCILHVSSNYINVKSHVEQCTILQGLHCSEKVVVAVHLKNTAALLTERFIKLNTAQHWKLKDVFLHNPLILRLQWQKAFQVYPLKFLMHVNSRPFEEVHRDNKEDSINCCDTTNLNISCAILGEDADASQVFCCPCQDLARGREFCNTSNLFTAHVMKYSPLWYSTYSISSPTVHHQMAVSTFQQESLESGDMLWRSLHGEKAVTVGTAQAQFSSDKFSVDYHAVQSDPQEYFDHQRSRLLVPNLEHTKETSYQGSPEEDMAEYMIVNTERFTDSGLECNKIGVQQTAFTNQLDRCNQAINSCLNNQPYDLWQHDYDALEDNQAGKYWLSNYISSSSFEVLSSGGAAVLLSVEYTQTFDVRLRIEINADDMIFIQKRLLGQIIGVKTFPVSTKSTTISINVYNNADTSAQFFTSVTVKEVCTVTVCDSQQSIHISPHLTQQVCFHLNYTEQCTEDMEFNVTLMDQTHHILMEQTLTVNLQDHCSCSNQGHCVCHPEGLQYNTLSWCNVSSTASLIKLITACGVNLRDVILHQQVDTVVLGSILTFLVLFCILLWQFAAFRTKKQLSLPIKSPTHGEDLEVTCEDHAIAPSVRLCEESDDMTGPSYTEHTERSAVKKRRTRRKSSTDLRTPSNTSLASTATTGAAGDQGSHVFTDAHNDGFNIQWPQLSSRSEVRKYVSMLLTKRYPVYYNCTEESTFLKDSGKHYSICGTIKKAGKSHLFTTKPDSKQVLCMRGGQPCDLHPPLTINADNCKKNLSADSIAKTITLKPVYPCLNSVL